MCEHPYILDRPVSKPFDSQGTIEDARRAASLPRIGTAPSGGNRDNAGSQKGFNSSKSFIMNQASSLDENRIVLYKKGKSLGSGYYIVEISSNNSILYIAAFDVESPESLLIELPEIKAKEILE